MRIARFSLVTLAAALLAAPAAAQQPAPARHTITHEDLFLMKRVGSPSISPDGRWIVFSVSEPAYAEARKNLARAEDARQRSGSK